VPTKVLVIDDDVAMTEMLRMILEPNAFDVSVANSGPEGIDAARNTNPEVIILALAMPDMDGWEVCREIRTFSQVPLLVLSAISNPGMVAKALDEGADDFLLKPMTSSVLIAHLKRLVWRSRSGQGSRNGNSTTKNSSKSIISPGTAVHRQTQPRRRNDEFSSLHAARTSPMTLDSPARGLPTRNASLANPGPGKTKPIS
jgi:DNA-binding response OmpR family regulator